MESGRRAPRRVRYFQGLVVRDLTTTTTLTHGLAPESRRVTGVVEPPVVPPILTWDSSGGVGQIGS